MNPRRAFQIGLLALAAATPCMANGASADSASVLALTVLLEPLIVAVLVISTGLRFAHTFCTWAGITAGTWFVMMLSLGAVSNSLSSREVGGALCLGGRPAVEAGDGVVLLHGLCRSDKSMVAMAKALAAEGYVVVNVDYPSRSATIADLAQTVVAAALSDPRLAGASRVHFVTHSLGGLLVRCYLAEHSVPNLGRVVMLGPPNQGSEVVNRLARFRFFAYLNGPAGGELGTGAASVPSRLGPVGFELGVIAGDRSINWINSLMIRGADDGKVSVERTKVEGMKGHVVVHATHPCLMKNRQVIGLTLAFLRNGQFPARKRMASMEGGTLSCGSVAGAPRRHPMSPPCQAEFRRAWGRTVEGAAISEPSGDAPMAK